MEEALFRVVAWTNYKLFVFICLICPLILSVWAMKSGIPSIQRLMVIFWRVASLMMIAIYLFIPVWQIGYLAWFVAHLFVVISLWFWADINDEIRDLPKIPIRLAIRVWRWATTFYGLAGAIVFIPFVRCAFADKASDELACRAWLELPWQYKDWFHSNATTGFLGFLGMSGLVIYLIYLAYFLTFRLIKQGRIALEQ